MKKPAENEIEKNVIIFYQASQKPVSVARISGLSDLP